MTHGGLIQDQSHKWNSIKLTAVLTLGNNKRRSTVNVERRFVRSSAQNRGFGTLPGLKGEKDCAAEVG